MCVRALRITVLKSAGNFTRDECHDLSAEKIQRVKCFMFTRCGICCVLAIFERRRGRLGSKISGCGQLAEVAVYFAMSGLPPEADSKRKGRHVRWVPILLQKSVWLRWTSTVWSGAAAFDPLGLTLSTQLQRYAMHMRYRKMSLELVNAPL